MKTNFHILYLVVIVFLLFLLRCPRGTEPTNKIIRDTLTWSKSDTILPPDTIIKFIYKPVSKPVTIYLDTNDNSDCDSIRTYKQEFDDKNLTVFTESQVKGILHYNNINYKLKVPLLIRDSIFTEIKETNFIGPQRKLLVGVQSNSIPNSFFIDPLLAYQDKRGRIYQFSYNIAQKSPNIGILIPLKFGKSYKTKIKND